MTVWRVAVVGYFLLVPCAPPSPAAGEDSVSVDAIVAALNGLEQRLDPIDVVYHFSATGPGGNNAARVSWKQQNNKARVSVHEEASAHGDSRDGVAQEIVLKATHEYLYADGILTRVTVGTQGDQPVKSSSRGQRSLGASGVLTVRALCNLMVSDVPEISLAQFITEQNRRRPLKWSVEPAGGLIKLTVPSRDAKSMGALIWLDPAKGYLPTRVIKYYHEGNFDPTKRYTERQITATHTVRDSLGNIDVPREFSIRLFGGGDEGRPPRVKTKVTFERFVVGKPIDASVFRLDIPAGYPVVDRTAGQLYTADSSGRPDPRYPTKSLPALEIPPDAASRPTSRPWYYSWWWAALSVPTALGAIYLIRVRRRRLA